MASLLFAQLALASYWCPADNPSRLAEALDVGSETGQSDPMPGCEEMDMEQPVLCHAHAQAGPQSVDRMQAPGLPPFFAATCVGVLVHIAIAPPSIVAPADRTLLTRATSPPIAVCNCCFRI